MSKLNKSFTPRRLGIGLIIILAVAGVSLGLRYLADDHARTEIRNVLLITLDTTRADHLGCYGRPAARTPALDKLAAEGVVFEETFSSVPLTLPSHTTMMTGLLPPEHGIRINGTAKLDIERPTLAEILKEQGFETAAFVASFTLNSKNGLNRGFDVYEDDMSQAYEHREDLPLSAYRPGNVVADLALAWLADRGGNRPFFCWVHFFDPHTPYFPHDALSGTPFADQRSYDAEIAFMDMQVARLLTFLNDSGLSRTTLVIAAGDHGEGLRQHGEPDHGYMLYETTLRVPLMFSLPGIVPEGRRVRDMVALVDLFATIQDLIELPGFEERSGRSLAAAVMGDSVGSAPCYSETNMPFAYNWSPLRSLTTPEWKYIRGAKARLFNRLGDPKELRNLVETHPEKTEEMEAALKAMEDAMELHAAAQVEMTAEAVRKLEALGYVTGHRDAANLEWEAFAGLPDVEDMLPARALLGKLTQLGPDAPPDRTVPLLRQLVKTSPNTPQFRRRLADPLSKSGHMEEAIQHLLTALDIDPQDAESHRYLGLAYRENGFYPEAVKHYSALLALKPDDDEARRDLALTHKRYGTTLGRKGNMEEAVKQFDLAIEHDPEDWEPRYLRGGLLKAGGDIERAVQDYRAAMRLRPEEPRTLNSLAWLLATHHDARFRNGAEAVMLAKKACEITKGRDPGRLDTLAAALAEAGRFEEAVETSRRAIGLAEEAGQENLVEELKQRLDRFQAGRSYHEAPP